MWTQAVSVDTGVGARKKELRTRVVPPYILGTPSVGLLFRSPVSSNRILRAAGGYRVYSYHHSEDHRLLLISKRNEFTVSIKNFCPRAFLGLSQDSSVATQ